MQNGSRTSARLVQNGGPSDDGQTSIISGRNVEGKKEETIVVTGCLSNELKE